MTPSSPSKPSPPRKKGLFARLLAWIARGTERAWKSGDGHCRT